MCEYVLMSDCLVGASAGATCDLTKANINVKVKNSKCVNSYEQHMCKEVKIEVKTPRGKQAVVKLMQKEATVTYDGNTQTFKKGNYPQPRTPVVEGVELFKVRSALLESILCSVECLYQTLGKINPDQIPEKACQCMFFQEGVVSL